MAPDRGSSGGSTPGAVDPSHGDLDRDASTRAHTARLMADRAAAPQNFTARSVVLGLAIGMIIVFSNMYFGLQTGWISGLSMPSALLGFATFRAWAAAFPAEQSKYKNPHSSLSRFRRLMRLRVPFSPIENVLVQTVAGSAGTMPLGCGFVGVIVALEFLLDPANDGHGPLDIGIKRLIIYAVGISLFGVVFGVPLRKQVLIKEKLKFPSGTATALMIGVLHGEKEEAQIIRQDDSTQDAAIVEYQEEEEESIQRRRTTESARSNHLFNDDQDDKGPNGDWKGKVQLMGLAFAVSAAYTIFSYFVPQVHNIPIFGNTLATTWLWTLNPSPAYIGQGIIMGPATTIHMLIGAILGWGILSPLAKHQGWATGPVGSWASGSKGWIVWISLAIMLADSFVSLAWLVLRPAIFYLRTYGPTAIHHVRRGEWNDLVHALNKPPHQLDRTGYAPLLASSQSESSRGEADVNHSRKTSLSDESEMDAPPEHLIHSREFLLWLVVSLAVYFASIHVAFPSVLPFGLDILALLLAGLLAVMGVRALGSTDLNPVSGISKLTQLIFATVVSPADPQAVTINLLAGAVSEAGSIQAGDLLQDLKTGHLLGAAPNAQFYGQIIGSVVGAVASAFIYKLYTSVYTIPSGQFQVPTAYVWLFTAELVTGKGLPPKAAEFALAFAVAYTVLTVVRIFLQSRTSGQLGPKLLPFVPGGIAVAVGMYNTPNFTLARTAGGILSGVWVKWRGKSESTVVVLASGLILGEGLFSILNLGFAKLGLPHT